MKWVLTVIFMGILSTAIAQPDLETGGMKMSYRIENDSIRIELYAPTTGWLAIGFHTRNEIVGADLKMLRIVGNRPEAEDRKTRRVGYYPSDTEFGGENNIEIISGVQDKFGTKVTFRIPLNSGDTNDFIHHPGEDFWMILAYSASPDFEHHSRMRKHLLFKW